MAERKAVNKYYPPEWDPSKGSINHFRRSHHLRGRVHKVHKLGGGAVTIRFEMPFNIWCGGCNAHIAMGVRFNAEKKKVGDYFSTPIFSFRMKCAQCPNWFEIRTDPKETDYVVVEGAKRKIESWTNEPGSTVLRPEEDLDVQKKRATNAFFQLEKVVEDEKRLADSIPYLERLFSAQENRWKDDYRSSQIARGKFRMEKKDIEFQKKIDRELVKKRSISGLELLPEDVSDIARTSSIQFRKDSNCTIASLISGYKKRNVK